jgi:hypothetical protein
VQEKETIAILIDKIPTIPSLDYRLLFLHELGSIISMLLKKENEDLHFEKKIILNHTFCRQRHSMLQPQNRSHYRAWIT